ncbi:MAG: hypothetical protein JWM57_650 [Phycisphaerales bacterium]|nr:hypothetical protein [Phycisphaerales bacterium]
MTEGSIHTEARFEPLNYAIPPSVSRRRVKVAILLAVCFAAGYLATELAIWNVLFYGFGFPVDTSNSLWDSDRFFFSFVIEVVLAAIGAFIVALTFGLFRTGAGSLKLLPLCIFAAGLGAIKTSVPWIASDLLHLFQSDPVALLLGVILPFPAGLALVWAARYQSDKSGPGPSFE